MSGNTDDKKQQQAAPKRGLFGWLRGKPAAAQTATAEQVAETAQQPEENMQPAVETQQAETATAAAAQTATQQQDPDGAQQQEPVAASDTAPAEADTATTAAEAETASEPAAAEPAPETVPVAEPVSGPVAEEPATVEPEPAAEPEPEPAVAAAESAAAVAPDAQNKKGWFARLRQGLAKTGSNFGEGVASLFLGRKAIDDELFEELETRLLLADVGVEATTEIVERLTQRVRRNELADSGALYQALQDELEELLQPIEQPLVLNGKAPQVILVVGVNGAGKTTTIGKLAARLQREGKKVMLAAGDTFRAAAVEQLQVWGERNHIPVIAQHTGADSASVIFDAVQAAQARGMDVLIADTAGRLHTKDNLMEELKKVQRVISRLDASAPHEVLLVLDAGTGQNALNQTRQFNAAVEVTGLVLTKLDGTAKGGIIFALGQQFGIPVRFIGVGEGIDDLRPFVASDFVRAIFSGKDAE